MHKGWKMKRSETTPQETAQRRQSGLSSWLGYLDQLTDTSCKRVLDASFSDTVASQLLVYLPTRRESRRLWQAWIRQHWHKPRSAAIRMF